MSTHIHATRATNRRETRRGATRRRSVMLSLAAVAAVTTAALGGTLALRSHGGAPAPDPWLARAQAMHVGMMPDSVVIAAGASYLLPVERCDAAVGGQESASWTSSDDAVARFVGNSGLIAAERAGRAVLRVDCGRTHGETVVVVQPGSAPRAWPNEPSGFVPVADEPWNVASPGNWLLHWGTATVAIDSTAPLSPPNVLQIVYPPGFTGGVAPGTLEREIPPSGGIYTGMWWKVNEGWQGHPSNVNKIQFLFADQDAGDIYLAFYGTPGGPYELRVVPQFPGAQTPDRKPNRASAHVTLGAWHRIEWLVLYPGPLSIRSGVVRWWLDGVLIGEYTDVRFPDRPLVTYKISPTWGGVGGTKRNADRYLFDHVYLSAPLDTSR